MAPNWSREPRLRSVQQPAATCTRPPSRQLLNSGTASSCVWTGSGPIPGAGSLQERETSSTNVRRGLLVFRASLRRERRWCQRYCSGFVHQGARCRMADAQMVFPARGRARGPNSPCTCDQPVHDATQCEHRPRKAPPPLEDGRRGVVPGVVFIHPQYHHFHACKIRSTLVRRTRQGVLRDAGMCAASNVLARHVWNRDRLARAQLGTAQARNEDVRVPGSS